MKNQINFHRKKPPTIPVYSKNWYSGKTAMFNALVILMVFIYRNLTYFILQKNKIRLR